MVGLLDDTDLRTFVILALEMSLIEQNLRISFYITRKVVRLLMHVFLVLVLYFIFFLLDHQNLFWCLTTR